MSNEDDDKQAEADDKKPKLIETEVGKEWAPVRDMARQRVKNKLWNDGKELELIQLYQRMYEITVVKCKRCAKGAGSCCHIMMCEMVEKYAKKEYGVTLLRTGHSKLLFMGSNGCIVAPHLRPVCTTHTCKIVTYGCDFEDKPWTADFFELKKQIALLECDRINYRRRGNAPL